MDAWVGRTPWVLVWLFFAATASAAPSSADRIAGALAPTDCVQPESRAIEKKQTPQPAPAAASTPSPNSSKLQRQTKLPPARLATPPEPAPPPDLPPSETAPAGAGFAVPTIGDAYIPEVPIEPEIPMGLGPAPNLNQHEAAKVDDTLIIDETWRGGDAGLISLCGLPGIKSLTIKNAPLTDAALDYIATLPNLKVLKIESTTFSARALAKLQRQRPIEIIIARGQARVTESTTR
jgi:hypothetical protein